MSIYVYYSIGKKYFKVFPLGNAYLIRKPYLDILVFENSKDLNVLSDAVHDLERVPDYILKDKSIRCLLYENSLKHYGFVDVHKNKEWEIPPRWQG